MSHRPHLLVYRWAPRLTQYLGFGREVALGTGDKVKDYVNSTVIILVVTQGYRLPVAGTLQGV